MMRGQGTETMVNGYGWYVEETEFWSNRHLGDWGCFSRWFSNELVK